MKILFLSDTFPTSNTAQEQVDWNIAKEMKDRGHDVFVLTSAKTKCSSEYVYIDGIKVFSVFTQERKGKIFKMIATLFNFNVLLLMMKIIYEVKPDVVHAHKINRSLSYSTLIVARLWTNKVFLTAHDVMGFQNIKLNKVLHQNWPVKFNFFIKLCLKTTKCIVSVSENLREVLNAHGIINVVTIYNGVNTKFWNSLNISNEKIFLERKIIMYVGLVDPNKSFALVLNAYEKYYEQNSDSLLVVVGDDKGSGYLNMVKENTQAPIQFLGRKSAVELKKLYLESDVVITFSILNPYSMVALEAMSMGLPVIWGCLSGTNEVPDTYKQYGFINDLNNPSELFLEIEHVLKNENHRNKIIDQQAERLKKLNLERQVSEYLDLYSQDFNFK